MDQDGWEGRDLFKVGDGVCVEVQITPPTEAAKASWG